MDSFNDLHSVPNRDSDSQSISIIRIWTWKVLISDSPQLLTSRSSRILIYDIISSYIASIHLEVVLYIQYTVTVMLHESYDLYVLYLFTSYCNL